MGEGFQFEAQGVERRYRKVRMSGELVLSLLAQGVIIGARCLEGLPREATIAGYGHDGRDFYLVFHAPQWEPVPDGHDIPDLPVRYERIEVP